MLKPFCFKEAPQGFLAARDLGAKRCVKTSLTQYSFNVMKSTFPATTHVIFIGFLRLKKRSTEKKTPERLLKGDRFESLRMLYSMT